MENPYTLLLVDDEEIIRNGITRKINWEEVGFKLLTSSENGEEAIQIIQQEEPDVVITDICMPRVDGLEVARYVMDNYPDILVVILSGYEDFDYARQAITYNVHEYLLKPLSSRKIRELLGRIHQELDSRKAQKLNLDTLKLLQEERKQILLERALCRLASGPVRGEELKGFYELLPFDYAENNWFSVVCLDIDDSSINDETGSVTTDLYLLAMREFVEDFFSRMTSPLICQPFESRLIVILGGRSEEDSNRSTRFAGNQLHKSLQNLSFFTASVGIGLAYCGIENVYQSYNEALSALDGRLVAGANSVFYHHNVRDVLPEKKQRFSSIQSSLKMALRQKNGDGLTSLVQEFCFLLKDSGLSVKRIRLEIDKLVFSIIDFLDSLSDGFSQPDEVSIVERMAELSKLTNLNDVEVSLTQLLQQISDVLKEKRRNFPESKVRDIQAYLKDNFQLKDLTVESVTTIFYISPSYLSKLFKQYTEKTFIEYLTELRVARACELLKTTNRKLFEIAEIVGYSDPGYFTSIFKKYRGITMSQYRDCL